MIDEKLNPQSALLWEWRETLRNLLIQPLGLSDEGEATGTEVGNYISPRMAAF
jgi:hypothetical protein